VKRWKNCSAIITSTSIHLQTGISYLYPPTVADDAIGIKAGVPLISFYNQPFQQKHKIATLIYAYGFKQAEAEAIVPLTPKAN
jgi:hypothetical protein